MKNAYIKFILAAVIFGTNGIIASQLPLSSYEIVLTRTVLGGLFLLLLATARHEWGSLRHVTRASLGWLVLSGLFLAGTGSSSMKRISRLASAWPPSCATAVPS